MKKFFEKLGDGVVKEWGMIVALVLLAMPPMFFAPVFFGGLHAGFVNGFSSDLWYQLKYPIIDMGILMFVTLLTVEIVQFVGKKWFKWIIYSFAIALATARIWLWWVFRMRISPLALSLLLETNSQESSEFIQLYLFGWYGVGLVGIVLGLIGLCILFEWLSKRVVFNGVWKKIVIVVSVVCVVWGMVEMRWEVRLVNCEVSDELGIWQYDMNYVDYCYSAFNAQSLLFSIVSVKCNLFDIEKCGEFALMVAKTNDIQVFDNDSLVVVFVLGESYIKSHCEEYGYERNTTPLLEQERKADRLFLFNDVVTPYTQTIDAIKMLFFTNDVSEKWCNEAFFPQLFKMAGFNVDMWDNQIFFNANSSATFGVFSILCHNVLRQLSYSNLSKNHFIYDELLIDDYIDNSFNFNSNRLIVFHLMGQHLDASERFPHTKDNMVFKGTDKKSNEIATYDNACLYNDKVVMRIINLVRYKKSVVVYLSDHGEEVYDYRNSCGRKAAEHGLEKEFLKCQAEVPFMIWCSDKYKEAYPEIVKDIEASVNKPFITSNVCHVMFHLAGLKSPWYKEERDLLSDKYKCERRIVDGRYDYDVIMSR